MSDHAVLLYCICKVIGNQNKNTDFVILTTLILKIKEWLNLNIKLSMLNIKSDPGWWVNFTFSSVHFPQVFFLFVTFTFTTVFQPNIFYFTEVWLLVTFSNTPKYLRLLQCSTWANILTCYIPTAVERHLTYWTAPMLHLETALHYEEMFLKKKNPITVDEQTLLPKS